MAHTETKQLKTANGQLFYPTIETGTDAGIAYDGAAGASLASTVNDHTANTSNPHDVTKEQVGLATTDKTINTETYKELKIDTAKVQVQSAIEDKNGNDITATYATENFVTDSYQPKLTFDTTPTESSTNPVTSGGIKTYVDALATTYETIVNSDAKIKELSGYFTTIDSMLTALNGKQRGMYISTQNSAPITRVLILYDSDSSNTGRATFIYGGVVKYYVRDTNSVWTLYRTFTTQEWVNTQLATKQSTSEKGQPSGYASLDSGGKVPSTQLPSYVDDVLEYANLASFPATGSASVIYVALDTNLTYRWSGSGYVEISPSLALGETSSTAYRGDNGKTAYDHSQITDGSNPHGTTFSSLASKPTTLSGFGITDAVNSIISITYANLKTLRDSSQLIKGQQYRITDFTTTTAQADTQSANHAFDLIVIADDVNKLNEQARAIKHSGDTYFANSRLEAWQVWYSLDNDTNRFAWADSVNGKGVIYRLIDEFNNDCPYDFKNIQFKRKLTNGVLDLDTGVDTWVYTFTLTDLIDNSIVDISLKQNTEYPNDEGQYCNCSFNTIKEAILDYEPDGLIRLKLNDNVFLNMFDGNIDFSYYGCSYNTFGSGCFSNTFGNSCSFNTFGDSCSDNTFGNSCSYNTFGNGCRSNTFGNAFSRNYFGNGCGYNTFGDYCQSNTFGNNCNYNTFDNACSSNTFGNGCAYLKISDSTGTQKKYIHVDDGTSGASSANKFDLYDAAILNKNYQVTFKKSASGKYLMLWATDTGTMTGKVKDSNIDTTWEDIV